MKTQKVILELTIPDADHANTARILRDIFERGMHRPTAWQDFTEKFMLALWGAVAALAVQHYWG